MEEPGKASLERGVYTFLSVGGLKEVGQSWKS